MKCVQQVHIVKSGSDRIHTECYIKEKTRKFHSFLHSMNDHVEKQPPLPPTSIGLQESRLFGSMIEFSITRTLTVLNLQQKWILNIHNCFPHDFGTFWRKKSYLFNRFLLNFEKTTSMKLHRIPHSGFVQVMENLESHGI